MRCPGASDDEARCGHGLSTAAGTHGVQHRCSFSLGVLAELEERLREHEAILGPAAGAAKGLRRSLVAGRQLGRPSEVGPVGERCPEERLRFFCAAQHPVRERPAQSPDRLPVPDLGDESLGGLLGACGLVVPREEVELHIPRAHGGSGSSCLGHSLERHVCGHAAALELRDGQTADGLHVAVVHHVRLARCLLDALELCAEKLLHLLRVALLRVAHPIDLEEVAQARVEALVADHCIVAAVGAPR
mmetsp:Transcript_14826/g.40577  ORF Transcript_14826/g.40577 Transcript_14826/m.40577 type:complete len:246 (-) Transcript_14826:640-1377(-)